MSVTPEPETPWALLKRLRAEGHPDDAIVARLKALGLENDDVKVLMMEAPPPASGLEMPDAVKAAAILAGGPLLGGLLVASMSEATVAREPPPPQVALAADDPSPRCAHHPELASVGTCPRCGSFVCRTCAGSELAQGCGRCQTSPTVRKKRLAGVGRRLALAGFAGIAPVAWMIVDWLIDEPQNALEKGLRVTVMFCAVPAIFSVLQLIRPMRWAAVLVMVWNVLLGGYMIFSGGGSDHLVAVVQFIVVGVMAVLQRGFDVSESRGSAPADPARPAAPAPPP
jgi:hypothetical protein